MATGRKTKKRPADGDFWAFKAGDGFGVLRVRSAASGVCAVYGRIFPKADMPLSEVAKTPVAFNVRCELPAYDGFSFVGNEPLPAELQEPVWFWSGITADPDHVSLVSSHGIDKEAPIAEAHGLERDGGYSPGEIAKRLIAWIEKRDTTMEENERQLREKRWV